MARDKVFAVVAFVAVAGIVASRIFLPSFERDLNSFCSIVKTISSRTDLDPAKRAYELSREVTAHMRSRAFVHTFQAMSMVENSQKYAILLQSAKEEGVKQWSCPEIEAYFNPSK